MKGEIRKLPMDGGPRLCRIIIGIDIVDANNRAAILEEPSRKANPIKPAAPVTKIGSPAMQPSSRPA
jgi:hypothetical protein